MTRAERHVALVAAHRAGDPTALGLLAEDVTGLARWAAKKYSRPGVDREDLVGEAWLGFMDAVGSFDPAKGSFATHCVTWMRERVSRAVTRGLGSRGARRAFWRGGAAAAVVEARGELATPAAVAAELGVTEEDVVRSRSREEALNGREPAAYSDLDGQIDDERQVMRLRVAVAELPPRLRRVIEGRLEGRNMAKELGVSKQRIQQMKAQAFEILREEMKR